MIGRIASKLMRLRRDARGVTLLEFGFVAPPLMLSAHFYSGVGHFWKALLREVHKLEADRQQRDAVDAVSGEVSGR